MGATLYSSSPFDDGPFPPRKKKPVAAAAPAVPARPNSFSYTISAEQSSKLYLLLRERGYEFKTVPYTTFAATREKLTVNAYTSGKLLVQGKGAAEFVEFILEPEILGEAKQGYTELHNPEMFEPHLGIDESGKGDFFGPLVIAGVYTKKATARRLLDMGVRDSKTIGSDAKAEELADEIKEVVGPAAWKVMSIGPEKYNDLYGKFRNLNRLLAWGHATVIENLLQAVPDCPRALSDQFADPDLIKRALKEKGKLIVMEQRTKAESDIAVAAASILARAEFIRRLRQLGEGAGTPLPKGASALTKATAKKISAEKGPDVLRKMCKAHFKTYYEATGIMDPTMNPNALDAAKLPQSYWAEKRKAYRDKAGVSGPGVTPAPAPAPATQEPAPKADKAARAPAAKKTAPAKPAATKKTTKSAPKAPVETAPPAAPRVSAKVPPPATPHSPAPKTKAPARRKPLKREDSTGEFDFGS